jgi:glycosyltransferase involved in cell wall biosynthesis
MKIAYCATVQPAFGGLKTFNTGLVQALSELCRSRGIEFILVTHSAHFDSFPIPESEKRSFSGNHFLFESFGLPQLLKRESVDWAIFPHNRLPLFGVGARRSAVIIHDLLFWRYPSQFSFLKRATRYAFMSMALKKADLVFSVSEFTKRELKAFGFQKEVEVCLEGIEPISIKPHFNYEGRSFPLDKPYFLFIGAMSFQKNIPSLIQAFTKVRESRFDCRLVLAGGKGTEAERVDQECRNSPFLQDILRPGFVSEEEKEWLIRNALAFVFPSVYEGFGIPILEAFQLETPVICSDCASLPEVAGKAAMICTPDPTGLSNAMISLAGNEILKSDLIASGKERSREFDWAEVALSLVKKIS